MPDFFIIAGEASGDMHASSLVKELKKIYPDSTFTGIGGKKMRSEGVTTIFDVNEVNFIGFTAVLKNVFTIKSIMKKTTDAITRLNPAAIILVDFPGFNLRIAESVRNSYSGKIIYYIAPQVWAWHKSRVKIMKKILDCLIVVFPFEVAFFKKEGLQAHYAGHPLIRRIDSFLSANSRVQGGKLQISFLPGSRKGEVESILPEMIKAGKILSSRFQCDMKIICAPHLSEDTFTKYAGIENFELIHEPEEEDANYSCILNSDLVITKSGTSTLECALIGTPFLVVYKTSPVNYAIGKSLVDVKYISIVNLLLDKLAVKEYVQHEMTAEAISKEAEKILTDKEYSSKMKDNFKELRQILGNKDASREAAEIIDRLISNKP
jgi:lipid-A-disaccharide synthase